MGASCSAYELSDIEWLQLHHRAKESERKATVASLPLRPGDRVLDLGCGPGLWIPLLRERVQPGGSVVGLDIDISHLVHARRAHHALTCRADLGILPFRSSTFDAVFFSNGFVYLQDPVAAIREQARVTRVGRPIIGRHFDNTAILLNPVPPELMLTVMKAATAELRTRQPYFDNSFGQKMHGAFLQANLGDVETTTYAIQKVPPLSPPVRSYIGETARWYGRVAKPRLPSATYHQWQQLFDESSANILDSQVFYFCLLEMQTIGWVTQNE